MFKTIAITHPFGANIKPLKISANGKRKYISGAESRWGEVLVLSLIALNASLLLSFLLGVNTRAATGYEIRQLQKKQEVMLAEKKALSLKLSEMTAISNISNSFYQSGFVQAGTPKFIEVGTHSTALK